MYIDLSGLGEFLTILVGGGLALVIACAVLLWVYSVGICLRRAIRNLRDDFKRLDP
jgi:hypothetical protein